MIHDTYKATLLMLNHPPSHTYEMLAQEPSSHKVRCKIRLPSYLISLLLQRQIHRASNKQLLLILVTINHLAKSKQGNTINSFQHIISGEEVLCLQAACVSGPFSATMEVSLHWWS